MYEKMNKEKIKQLELYSAAVTEGLVNGQSKESIIAYLIKNDIDEESATKFVNDVEVAVHKFVPSGLKFEDTSDHIKITRNWMRMGLHKIVFALFVILGTGYCLVGLGATFAGETDFPVGLSRTFYLLFICFAYYGVAQVLNVTKIDVTKDNIKIKHGPIPWSAGKQLRINEIRRFHIIEKAHRKAKRLRTLYSYQLRATMKDGKDELIAKGFVGEQAHFTKFWIERFFGTNTEQWDAG